MEKVPLDLDKLFALVSSNGIVYWWTPIELSVGHCSMDITWFPLDTQYCPFVYESWAYPSGQLNITPFEPAVELDYYQTSGEWLLLGNNNVVFTPCFKKNIHSYYWL